MTTDTTPRSGVGDRTTVVAPGPRPRRRDGLAAWAFLSPSILMFTVFVLAPTLGVLLLSFYNWNLLSDGEFVGFDNFDRLVHDQRLLGVYGSTTYMALVILAVNVVLGLLLAVLLETRMPRVV